MSEYLYLSALINVFGVIPTFLLPVFSNGRQFFFQVIENNAIAHFEIADLSQFAESPAYQISDRSLYAPKCPAVYAIDMPGGKYVFGNSDFIADAYLSNQPDFNECPDFIASMERFLKQTEAEAFYRSKCKSSASLVPVNTIHYWDNISMQSFNTKKYLEQIDLADISQDFMVYFSKNNMGLSLVDTAAGIETLCNQSALCYHNRQFIFNQVDIFENSRYALGKSFALIPKTRNIFDFRQYLKDPAKADKIRYCKTPDDTPVEAQIRVLDILLQYEPKTYASFVSLKSHYWKKDTLWSNRTVFKIYQSLYGQLFKPQQIDLQIKKWGIDIDRPKQRIQDDDSESMEICWNNQLPYIEEEAEMEDALLFWFEIKMLSDQTYMMIAQNYNTHKNYFRLKEHGLSSNDLISFIIALYHDICNEKVMLLRLRSEKFSHLFDDKLTDWLSENDDKCSIRDIYYDIRGHHG